MKRFQLHRDTDVSGVSGTGIVAEGVQFTDGKCVIRWYGKHISTVIWDTLEDAKVVHGHDGKTRFVFLDE